MMQQAKQGEAAKRCRVGKEAVKEAAAKEAAATEAAANASKGSQPAVVQLLSSTA